MLQRPIPSSGEMLPVVGCGTWAVFDVGASPAERAGPEAVVRELFAGGGALLDSSPMYGRAEQVTGDALAAVGLRDRAFVATKVWTEGRAAGERQIAESLRLLGGARLDLLQIHNLVDWQTHLPTLRAARDAGRVRYLGITHYTPSAHRELEAVLRAAPWDFVQLDYALDDRAAELRLLPLARERGVAVLVNRPLGSGRLVERLRGVPLPGWAAELGCATWAQAALKFVLGHAAVTCVIPATRSAAHMRENCAAGQAPLPDAALRERMARDFERR